MSKIVTDKRQSQLSEPIVWPLRHSQKGQFLSQEEVGGIVVIKTPLTHAKTENLASKNITTG